MSAGDYQPAIQLKDVEKRFGRFTALHNVSLTVQKGHVHGFLGLNGAGKTTTIKLLMNFLHPSSGKVEVLGRDAQHASTELKHRVGYLSGDFELYNNLTGGQYLDYIAHLRHVEDMSEVQKLCRELEAVLDRPIGTLSRGNKQKIGLISALIGSPDLLILDEPTTGLDPVMQQKFYEVVRRHADSGKTVFMSSHIISEVQEVCDTITFMRKGQITETINVKDLRTSNKRHVAVKPLEGKKIDKPPKVFGASDMVQLRGVVEFDIPKVDGEFLNWLSKQPIADVTISQADLEKIFLSLYHEDAHV